MIVDEKILSHAICLRIAELRARFGYKKTFLSSKSYSQRHLVTIEQHLPHPIFSSIKSFVLFSLFIIFSDHVIYDVRVVAPKNLVLLHQRQGLSASKISYGKSSAFGHGERSLRKSV